MAKKLLKNLLVRYSISFEIFSASVYSLKDFIVYFSMYFSCSSWGTSCIILYLVFFVNTFFDIFLFFYFGQNKKLVIPFCGSYLNVQLLLILLFFIFLSVARYLFIIAFLFFYVNSFLKDFLIFFMVFFDIKFAKSFVVKLY